ncbi:FERM/acyl-CoA-binding protein, 3-helical bundle [Artemisia annua]|uniref:FERM/acyl-CoA-binding protein, 3-helical bundle n=1 Tax=Artemisia annua TaxID=35608 RepID=A0A2U1MLG8_ARTAN|nr:FERM/acyl-CoA-binding protein, 3-helical bundle [Artemisia annua]
MKTRSKNEPRLKQDPRINPLRIVEEEDVIFEDDDWHGIETTELEKRFGAVVAFIGSKSSSERFGLMDNDVKVELYGLQKVANDCSCFESQPTPLKVSTRANW